MFIHNIGVRNYQQREEAYILTFGTARSRVAPHSVRDRHVGDLVAIKQDAMEGQTRTMEYCSSLWILLFFSIHLYVEVFAEGIYGF